MVQDTDRSMKNFTPEDRANRRARQIEAERDRLRAQVEAQEGTMVKLARIVLDVAPDRITQLGLSVEEAREWVRAHKE